MPQQLKIRPESNDNKIHNMILSVWLKMDQPSASDQARAFRNEKIVGR
jgi:hypothetical protein